VKLRLTALEAAGVAIRALPDLMQMLGRIAREVVLQLQPGPAQPGLPAVSLLARRDLSDCLSLLKRSAGCFA